jgi:hypothetical protein
MGCNKETPLHTVHERVSVLTAVLLMCGSGGIEDTTSELYQFPFRDFCTFRVEWWYGGAPSSKTLTTEIGFAWRRIRYP